MNTKRPSCLRSSVLALALLVTLGAPTASAAVAHVKDFANTQAGTTSWTFASFTPGGTGDGVVVGMGCASSTSPTLAITGTGWTFTQVGTTVGSLTAGWFALFKAYAPNTTAVTFAGTSSVTCNAFENILLGEFSGVDGTNFIDVTPCQATATSGSATCSVTPASSNDGLIFLANDNVTTISGGYTLGADDLGGDRAEWKILAGGAGVAQTPSWTASGAYTIFGVALKPSGGGGATPCNPTLMLLGVSACGDAL